MFKKGIFTISIDLELAWGTFDHGGHIKFKDAYSKCRFIITRLLALFDKYNISATWAIVGHLFLEQCQKINGILHPDIVRPNYSWFKKDWFAYDPATDVQRDSIWYAKDVVEMIKKTSPEQEIGSHSFSHIIFSDEGCSGQAAETDIAKCVSIAQDIDIKLESFIFPRNASGHLDILAKYGFKTYRANDRRLETDNGKRSSLGKARVFLEDMMLTAPPVVIPFNNQENNLFALPPSMLFRYSLGLSKLILPNVRLLKAKKGIRRAINERKIFHLWFHPVNFVWDSERLFNEFEEILKFASQLRDKSKLEIMPLREIVNQYNKNDIDNDKFNPESIILHDEKADYFKSSYLSDLADYHTTSFKFGRRKIVDDFQEIMQKLNQENHILDVGCGTGYFINLLFEYGFKKIIGVDLSIQMLLRLKENNRDAFVQRADAKKLPFKDNSFDAVISIETIRYFHNRNNFLNEIYRVLKPGGLAFITAAPLFSLNLYGIFNSLCRICGLPNFVSCYQSFETVGSFTKRMKKVGFDSPIINGHFFGPYFILDKIIPNLSMSLIKRFEKIDNVLSRVKILRNFTNHLVAVMKKPKKGGCCEDNR